MRTNNHPAKGQIRLGAHVEALLRHGSLRGIVVHVSPTSFIVVVEFQPGEGILAPFHQALIEFTWRAREKVYRPKGRHDGKLVLLRLNVKERRDERKRTGKQTYGPGDLDHLSAPQ